MHVWSSWLLRRRAISHCWLFKGWRWTNTELACEWTCLSYQVQQWRYEANFWTQCWSMLGRGQYLALCLNYSLEYNTHTDYKATANIQCFLDFVFWLFVEVSFTGEWQVKIDRLYDPRCIYQMARWLLKCNSYYLSLFTKLADATLLPQALIYTKLSSPIPFYDSSIL